MRHRSRREFLGELGKGLLGAGLGAGMAETLSIRGVSADDGPESLSFGEMEPLLVVVVKVVVCDSTGLFGLTPGL